MILSVPNFARLSDYLGAWCMEEAAFLRLWALVARLDLRAADAADPMHAATDTVAGPGGKKIAVVRLGGALMKSASSWMGGTSTVQARRDIRAAAADGDVAGILLAIDSPGGTVSGTHDLAAEVKAAKREKPVWAAVEDLGASAAYWVASQADRITANSPTALVGSIGTIQVIYDTSAAADAEGVRTILVRTGPLKGLGFDGAKVTDEQVAHVQGLVDSVQQSFDQAVRDGRGMSAKELAAVRHGGVVTAAAAKDLKLIDAVQPLGRTVAEFGAALKGGTAADYRRAMEILQSGRYEFDSAAGVLLSSAPVPVTKPPAAGGLPTVARRLPVL